MILINQKNKLSALTFAATLINLSTLFSGTGNLEINVDGTNIGTFSGHLTAGTVNKTDAGSLILSHPSNDIDVLEINGGEVVINTPSNINPTSIVVKFNASGIDPITSAVNTAKLRITDDMNTGLLDFTTDGEIEIDSSKIVTWNVRPTGSGSFKKTKEGVLKIDSDLGPQQLSSSFNTTSGFFESGTNQLAWPSRFTGYVPYHITDGNPNWYTDDTPSTYDSSLKYGGVSINFGYNGSLGDSDGYIYWAPLGNLTGANPIIAIPTSIARIDIDEGTLYVQEGGIAPNAPINISSIAKLQLAGSADAEVGGDITVQAGGNIEVDENVKVGDVLTTTTTYNFNTDTGFFESGSEILPWPTNFKIFYNNPTGSTPEWSYWSTDNTSDQVVFYGGVRLEFLNSGWIGSYAYRNLDSVLSASHPTTTVITDTDVALSGSVSMESGSKINLKAGSTWAHAVTVTSAS